MALSADTHKLSTYTNIYQIAFSSGLNSFQIAQVNRENDSHRTVKLWQWQWGWLINYSWSTCTAHVQSTLTIVKSLTVDFTDIRCYWNVKKCRLWKDDTLQNTILLAVRLVVLLSCFLNGLITLQMANTRLFNTSLDGWLAILMVKMMTN